MTDLLNYSSTLQLISQSEKISIISHINPDGDSIGATLALYIYLSKKGLKVQVIAPSAIPGFLKWMPEISDIIIGNRQKEKAETILQSSDLIICVDFNSTNRAGKLSDVLKNSKAKKILIDHHPNPVVEEFDSIISKTETSSTSELVYDFIVFSGDNNLIDKNIASCIYTGIITDTGSLSYNCNHVSSYHAVADLLSLGIDGASIHDKIYNENTEDRIRLLGHCLKNRMVVNTDLSFAYIYLTTDDLNQFNYRIGDTEDVVNIPLSIKGIHLSALFTEREEHIRLSLRSKGEFSVNDFVRKYFEGGGHKNAAGANSYVSMEKTIEIFEDAVLANKELIINSAER